MRILIVLIALVAFFASPSGAAEKKPAVTLKRVEADIAKIREHLLVSSVSDLRWPKGHRIEVEVVDRARMQAILLEEFRRDVRILHPDRPASSQEILAKMLANSYARVVRAKYGLITKKIHVATSALDGLPEDLEPGLVLRFILAHELVHALDDLWDLSSALARAPNAEAHRALRMVIEGRAEHFSAKVAPRLGIPREVEKTLSARRDPAEARLRDGGRRFIEAIEKRDLPGHVYQGPPLTTSVVFHPDRYGRTFSPPNAAAALAGADLTGKLQVLSELQLRNRLGERLKDQEIEKMFAGYLAGAAQVTPDELRVSLTEHDGAASAKAFLAGLMAFEGQSAGESATYATGPLAHPDGRKFKWWAWIRGPRVLHVVGPAGLDVAKKLGPSLGPAPREK